MKLGHDRQIAAGERQFQMNARAYSLRKDQIDEKKGPAASEPPCNLINSNTRLIRIPSWLKRVFAQPSIPLFRARRRGIKSDLRLPEDASRHHGPGLVLQNRPNLPSAGLGCLQGHGNYVAPQFYAKAYQEHASRPKAGSRFCSHAHPRSMRAVAEPPQHPTHSSRMVDRQ